MGLCGCGHGLVYKVMNAPDRLYIGYPQRLCDLFLYPLPGGLPVKLHLPSEEIILVEISEQ